MDADTESLANSTGTGTGADSECSQWCHPGPARAPSLAQFNLNDSARTDSDVVPGVPAGGPSHGPSPAEPAPAAAASHGRRRVNGRGCNSGSGGSRERRNCPLASPGVCVRANAAASAGSVCRLCRAVHRKSLKPGEQESFADLKNKFSIGV